MEPLSLPRKFRSCLESIRTQWVVGISNETLFT